MKQANIDASLLGSLVFFSRHVNEIINKRTWHKKRRAKRAAEMTLTGMWTEFHQKRLSETEEHTHIHTHEQKHTHAHAQLKMGENCKWTKLLLSSWSLVLVPQSSARMEKFHYFIPSGHARVVACRAEGGPKPSHHMRGFAHSSGIRETVELSGKEQPWCGFGSQVEQLLGGLTLPP